MLQFRFEFIKPYLQNGEKKQREREQHKHKFTIFLFICNTFGPFFFFPFVEIFAAFYALSFFLLPHTSYRSRFLRKYMQKPFRAKPKKNCGQCTLFTFFHFQMKEDREKIKNHEKTSFIFTFLSCSFLQFPLFHHCRKKSHLDAIPDDKKSALKWMEFFGDCRFDYSIWMIINFHVDCFHAQINVIRWLLIFVIMNPWKFINIHKEIGLESEKDFFWPSALFHWFNICSSAKLIHVWRKKEMKCREIIFYSLIIIICK